LKIVPTIGGTLKLLMGVKRILFISGSIGLGHVIRDCAIADRLRSLYPDICITWLAGQPAEDYLIERGEHMYTGDLGFADMSGAAEAVAGGGHLYSTGRRYDHRGD
jgi:hypothetical protein